MIKSRRARRMERHHEKAKTPGLNLIALMDIFTLLVFFLLVNSSSTQHMPNQKNMKLPMSSSRIVPEETLVVEITNRDILVQGRVVATVEEALKSADDIIPTLKSELLELTSHRAVNDEQKEHKITIMGDENISYDLIRKVLASCQQASYTKIAFAAMQKAKPNS
ncbi:MAG TPA: biopolymer transporter ExbD [Cellvibrio sp.]|nr:biopolymer transporter ExbD [Cellvibrio sp.]